MDRVKHPLLAGPTADDRFSRGDLFGEDLDRDGKVRDAHQTSIRGQERTVQNFRQREVRGGVEFTRPPTKPRPIGHRASTGQMKC